MIALLVLSTTLLVALQPRVEAAPLTEECATEISFFCASATGAPECLKQHKDSLTERCLDALQGNPRPASPAAPQMRAESVKPNAPRSDASVNGNHPDVQDGYSGHGQEFYPTVRQQIVAEMPGVIGSVSSQLGLPQYSTGFAHPLAIKFLYDPTTQDGLGYVIGNEGSGPDDWSQSMVIDLAAWEDCPSKGLFRSLYAHEMTHAILHDYLIEQSGAVPQWFDEGLAVYLSGGPDLPMMLRIAYYRHGTSYPGDLNCGLEAPDREPVSGAVLAECNPYFALAVQAIAQSKPDALRNVVKDLKSGVSLADAILVQAGMDSNALRAETDKLTQRTLQGMSLIDRYRGRWWYLLDCRG